VGTPCPVIFANEPFRIYPPCPSIAMNPGISPEVMGTVLSGVIVITFFLLFICIVAFALTLGD
jgi:hypothetical protein